MKLTDFAVSMKKRFHAFSLEEAERRARETGGAGRDQLAQAMRLSRQRRDAAEELWASHRAEALRLAKQSFEELSALAPEWAQLDAVTQARSALAAQPLPLFDEEIRGAHRLFATIVAAVDVLQRRLSPVVRDYAAMRASRRRVGAALAVTALLAMGWVVREHWPRSISASGYYDGRFPPANAFDGKMATEWLLPDRTEGWIDLKIEPPRRIRKLQLFNAQNLPYRMRGTREFAGAGIRNGKTVVSFSAAFQALGASQSVPIDQVIDHVRIEIKSYFGIGGGLAEVTLE